MFAIGFPAAIVECSFRSTTPRELTIVSPLPNARIEMSPLAAYEVHAVKLAPPDFFRAVDGETVFVSVSGPRTLNGNYFLFWGNSARGLVKLRQWLPVHDPDAVLKISRVVNITQSGITLALQPNILGIALWILCFLAIGAPFCIAAWRIH
jgi:hypothetical protein